MIRRIDLRGAAASFDYRAAVPRAAFDVEAATHEVRPICDAVRDRGVDAIREFSARFDGVEQDDVVVPPSALEEALGPASTRPCGRGWRSPCGGCGSPARPSSSVTSSPTWRPAPG